MKRIVSIFIVLLALFVSACNTTGSLDSPKITPQPRYTETPVTQPSFAPRFGEIASVEIIDSCAYMLEINGVVTFYGAVEYKNTGDCPVIVPTADFSFEVIGKGMYNYSCEPAAYDFNITNPNDTNYIVFYRSIPVKTATPSGFPLPNASGTIPMPTSTPVSVPTPTEGSVIATGDKVNLKVTLTAEKSDLASSRLNVSDLFLSGNYSEFSTLSGTVKNETANVYSLNLEFVGFYDVDDKLIGVWQFSKDLFLDVGDALNFVSQLRQLNIPDLPFNTASMRGFGIGFN
ncbi:MAG: hypothetical protein RRY79_06105 [Clostridia bacterium]